MFVCDTCDTCDTAYIITSYKNVYQQHIQKVVDYLIAFTLFVCCLNIGNKSIGFYPIGIDTFEIRPNHKICNQIECFFLSISIESLTFDCVFHWKITFVVVVFFLWPKSQLKSSNQAN